MPIHKSSQNREQVREVLNFIQNQQSILVGLKKQFRIIELTEIARSFKITVERSLELVAKALHESRLAALPWSQQSNHRMRLEVLQKNVLHDSRHVSLHI